MSDGTKYPECGGKIGHPHANDRIAQTKARKGAIIFDQQDFRHDHQLNQHQHEQNTGSAERKTYECIGRQGAHNDLADQDQCHQHECVQEVTGKWRGGEHLAKIVQGQGRGQVKIAGARGRMKCSPERK